MTGVENKWMGKNIPSKQDKSLLLVLHSMEIKYQKDYTRPRLANFLSRGPDRK